MSISRWFVGRIGVVLVLLSVSQVNATTISSTFDTDADGWTVVGQGVQQYVASGGNPGGFIRVDDAGAFIDFGTSAPAKFLGDLRSFEGGSMSFDEILLDPPDEFNPDSNHGKVTISSATDSAILDLVPDNPTNQWRSHVAPLTALAWGKSQTDWNALLSNVTSIEVLLEPGSGQDGAGLDNFRLVPEPSTLLALLSMGAVGLFVCAWRRGRC